MTDCKIFRSHLPDLLLDFQSQAQTPELMEHLAACGDCRTEFTELRSTFALLNEWSVPEPSPYFDSRLRARLRAAESTAPESLWERVHAFWLFSTGRHLRPALAGALVFVLLLGGGTFAGFYEHHTGAAQSQASSPALNDLRILDNNAQALQQMDQLLDDTGAQDAGTPPTT